jgi:PAS domain S-box-containing protein
MAGALRESADRIRDLYDNAPCGYHSVGPDGTILAINRTEMKWLGYKETEVVGRMRFADFVSPASRESYRDAFARVREDGNVCDVKLEIVRKDGTTFPVLAHSSSVRDDAGRYVRSRTPLTDLTERKKAEGAIRQFAELAHNIPIGLLNYQTRGRTERTLRPFGQPGSHRTVRRFPR